MKKNLTARAVVIAATILLCIYGIIGFPTSKASLMQNLEKKLQEVSDKLSKSTIDLVALQEKLMVARIKFQDGVADLSLEKSEEKKVAETAGDKPRG